MGHEKVDPAERFDPLAVDIPRLLAELGIEAEFRRIVWVARCPSGRHPDRKPSWEIIDQPGQEKHGLHTCRSCHWGGTTVRLVQQVFGLAGTTEAVRFIQQHAMGATRSLERLTFRVRPPEGARPEFRLPADVMVLPIDQWAATPRDYLLRDRKVGPWQVARWGLGYAIAGDLRGRIVFPARDDRGRLLNYTARTFVGAMVRYKSAPEHEGPDTAAVFGEQHWPRIDARSGATIFVTEGALNALAVEKALVPNRLEWAQGALELWVGALSGSKVQLEQVVKVSSFSRAVILTDPDPAGEAARERLEAALARHMEVRHVRFPAGMDAAKMAPEDLRDLCRTPTSAICCT